jgi:Kef-type K+ transport system membrane component KefB
MHSPLLLQLIVILSVASLCGFVLRRFGQPPVIGEMLAGVLLGPVVLGAAMPDLHASLFPAASLDSLSSLSTLGLVLFMFVVGAELRTPDGVRAQLRAAAWVSSLSVLLPFGASLALSPVLYPQLAPAGVGFWPFALFLATAMSITAFPVLARILKDRAMTRTRVGQLALGSAAIADVATWILLALVVALVGTGHGSGGFLKAVLGLMSLTALVFGLFKPLYAWLLRTHAGDGEPNATVLAALLVGMLACAALTEWLELHAVFGAFLFGACLPRDDRLLHALTSRLEHLAVVLLMPIFFALAGLRATSAAFAGPALAAMALIMVTAVAGKMLGGAVGARLAGNHWRDSLATGTLMNARGLMELIVLKVGLDAGLIGPPLFTMLLMMAILTTLMTGPLLGLLAGRAQATGDQAVRSNA